MPTSAKEYCKSRIIQAGFTLAEMSKNKRKVQLYAAVSNQQVIVGSLGAIHATIRGYESKGTVTIYTNEACNCNKKK